MAHSHQTVSSPGSVLVLGNYRPSLAVARALSSKGYRIIVGAEGDEGGCELSAHVAEIWGHPPLGDGAAGFLESLNRLLDKRGDIAVVFPVAEEFVNLIANAGWTPPRGVVLASPRHQTVRRCADKIEMLRLAHKIGVRTLPFGVVGHYGALFEAANRIGFPITVRPLGTTARLGHRKAVIAATPEELMEALPEWPDGHGELLLQRRAVGPRHNIYFAAQHGNLAALVASRIKRTNHCEGTGLAVCGDTIVPGAALVRDTEALVSELGYTGIGLAQFIVDPATGDRCFLELNPRVSGSHAVPEAAGVPLSAMAVDLARGVTLKVPTPYLQGAAGVNYVWTSGALVGLKVALARGEAGVTEAMTRALQELADAALADAHLVWAWNDPKPGLRAMLNVLPKFSRARTALAALLPRRRDMVRPA